MGGRNRSGARRGRGAAGFGRTAGVALAAALLVLSFPAHGASLSA